MRKTFVLGALGYGLVEILWRGYTHWSMLLAGGVSLCGMKRICARVQGVLRAATLCAGWITGVEFLTGILINRRRQVWDYSGQWGNIKGQICPLYSAFWFALSLPIVIYYNKRRDGYEKIHHFVPQR